MLETHWETWKALESVDIKSVVFALFVRERNIIINSCLLDIQTVIPCNHVV
jgi:hypothetical protein